MENCLMAIQILVKKCPKDSTLHIKDVIKVSSDMLEYDPH